MARDASSVTCLECGCLNFSSVYEKCDECRSKRLPLRPTVHRFVSNRGTFNISRCKYAAPQVSLPSKKRRYDETKNSSSKTLANKSTQKKIEPKPCVVRSLDVIDLVSDDEDEDVKVDQVARMSVKTGRLDEKDHDSTTEGLFQSRIFPFVTFVESDFISVEDGVQLRKKVMENAILRSRLAGQEKALNLELRPLSAVPQILKAIGEQKPVKSRPSSNLEANKEGAKLKTLTTSTVMLVHGNEKRNIATGTTEKDTSNSTVTTGQRTINSAIIVASTAGKDKEAKQVEKTKAESLFQSRLFDTIEYADSDFKTEFDGLALARRSHLISPSSNAASRCVGPAACSRAIYVNPDKSTGSAKAALADRSTFSSFAAKKEAVLASVESPSSATLLPATTAGPINATSTSNADVIEPVSMVAAATPVPSQSADYFSKPRPVTGKPLLPQALDIQSTPATTTTFSKKFQTPLTPVKEEIGRKIASSPSSAPNTTKVIAFDQDKVSAPAPPQKLPNLIKITPQHQHHLDLALATSASTLKPSSTSIRPAAISPSSALVDSSAAQNAPQKSVNVTVLKAKKKGLSDAQQCAEIEKRQLKALSLDAKASFKPDDVELSEGDSAAYEELPIAPPVLGYCGPEFLAFMRECGDEDGEEDEAFDEVSRSRLRLLDVVDLTHLSDSEDSDALLTPRFEITPNMTSDQVVNTTLNRSAPDSKIGNVLVFESERKRTQPEKALCELCEEAGALYRLIQCPTCTKYYHKKCARDNGDENVCWNCELGSLIDDSELDEEHAKHTSEYLTYLKDLRRSSSPVNEKGGEEESNYEEEEQDGDDAHDVDMNGVSEESAALAQGNSMNSTGKIWMEFLGGVTADVGASYHEVTNRITEELRDEEKKRQYSLGFVSREEFEAQMTEVEDYYISEEARLQQLDRERAIEAKKAAEAKKALAEAEVAVENLELAVSSSIGSNAHFVPAAGDQGDANREMALPLGAVASPINVGTPTSTIKESTVCLVAISPPIVPASSVVVPTLPAAHTGFQLIFDQPHLRYRA